jgi:NAD(P)H-hydrate epimerase
MAEIDTKAQDSFSLSSTVLMENAGIKLYHRMRELCGVDMKSGQTVFLVGKGNNGGDALVMARQAFVDGFVNLSIVHLTDELSGDPAAHLAACRKLSIPTYHWPSTEARTAVATASVLVDGIFGTGIRGEIRGSAAELVRAANDSPAFRVSIDVPSGLGDDFEAGFSALQADITLTVELPKRCLFLPAARGFAGKIETVSIGFPPQLLSPWEDDLHLLDFSDAGSLVPPLAESTYKTKRGVVGIFAGAPGTSGAAALCALGCGRSRAGLVHVFADQAVYGALAAQLSSILVHPWNAEDGVGDLSGFDAVLAGPGWGRTSNRQDVLRTLAEGDLPGVLDADGLNVLSDMTANGDGVTDAAEDASSRAAATGGHERASDSGDHRELSFARRWVLTPHPGECSRLTGRPIKEILSDPVAHCRALAERFNAVVVMKSHVTYIVPPEGRVRVVDGMNAALATGGSGDVLSGVIAALLASGSSAEDAAAGGVLIHSEAGRRARPAKGWFLAEDLPEFIGLLFEELF